MESRSALTYLDTHVAVWLHEGRADLISPRASEAIEQSELRISPIVVLEIEFLHELGRTTGGGSEVAESLGAQFGLTVCDLEFRRVIESAAVCSWTRDPFDRLIIGHARAGRGNLVTRDSRIRRNAPEVLW